MKPRSRSHPSGRLVSEVQISTKASQSPATHSRAFSSAGIIAQHVQVSSQRGYEFHWKGRCHYLALHDLHHRDAETHSDTLAVDQQTDLRGQLTFAAAGARVWGWSIPILKPQSFTAIYLDPDQIEIDLAAKLEVVPETVDLYFTNPALRLTLEKLQQGLNSAVEPDSIYLESLCLLALLQLCVLRQERGAIVASSAGKLSASLEQKLTAYVDANLARDIGLSDLAQVAGLSRYHFLRAFKRTTGLTPYQYLLGRRVAMAQRLLREHSRPLSDIATAVGFKDVTPLIRAFRKITGVTPGVYRNA